MCWTKALFPTGSQDVSVFCHCCASIIVRKAIKEAAVSRNLNALGHLRWPVQSSKLESAFLFFSVGGLNPCLWSQITSDNCQLELYANCCFMTIIFTGMSISSVQKHVLFLLFIWVSMNLCL